MSETSASYSSTENSAEPKVHSDKAPAVEAKNEAPKETIKEKKCCKSDKCECKEKCPAECCCGMVCPCCKMARNHFYSAITFKNKIAYGMMVAFYIWIVIMAWSRKNLLFKVLLTAGVLKVYFILVPRLCEPSEYEKEAEEAIKKLREKCMKTCPCNNCCSVCDCKCQMIVMYCCALLCSFLISGRVYIPLMATVPVMAPWVRPILALPFVQKALAVVKPYAMKSKEAAEKVVQKAKATLEDKTKAKKN